MCALSFGYCNQSQRRFLRNANNFNDIIYKGNRGKNSGVTEPRTASRCKEPNSKYHRTACKKNLEAISWQLLIFILRDKEKIRGEVNDVYQYNNIPHALRVQIIKIITDSIGFPSSNERYTSYRNEADKVYAYIHEILSKEYGVFFFEGICKE